MPKLRNTARPVAEKDLKADKTAEEYPYEVVLPGQRQAGKPPRYFKSLKAAKEQILKDLHVYVDNAQRLNLKNDVQHIKDRLGFVEEIGDNGGHVEIRVDEYMNVHYRAQVVKRAAS